MRGAQKEGGTGRLVIPCLGLSRTASTLGDIESPCSGLFRRLSIHIDNSPDQCCRLWSAILTNDQRVLWKFLEEAFLPWALDVEVEGFGTAHEERKTAEDGPHGGNVQEGEWVRWL